MVLQLVQRSLSKYLPSLNKNINRIKIFFTMGNDLNQQV
jgi:hypothetical protein